MPKWKELFSTPKKAALTIGCLAVVLATLGVCVAIYLANAGSEPAQAGKAIGGETAKNFAFADAGVDPAEATAVSARYGRWEDRFVYEVGFIAGDTEYTYQIDAFDGSVAHKETKTVKGPDESADLPAAITLEEAREIALTDAGLAREEASFTRAELEDDASSPVYEFQFYAGNVEYGYEINARTGAVYSKSVTTYVGQGSGGVIPPVQSSRPVESTPPVPESAEPSQAQPRPSAGAAPQPSGAVAPPSANVAPPSAGITPPGGPGFQGMGQSRISPEEAKRAALEDAGIAESEAVFKEVKLDTWNGAVVYEIEFVAGAREFEYEIDAVTGTVLDASWDDWD